MKATLLRRFKLFLLINLILIYATNGLSQIVPQSLFQVNRGEKNSSIAFQLPDQWKIKLLNESPAFKILLKIYHKQDKELPELLSENSLPDKTGFKQYRITPLTPSSVIFVFELTEKLDFGWDNSRPNSLMIHDEHYYDESEWFYRKGLQYHAEDKLKEALSAYRKAVFRNRQHGNAYFKAGQIRFEFQQYRMAEINYKHALRLKCDSVNLYRSMAELYEVYGQTDLARKYNHIYKEEKNSRAKPPILLTESESDSEKIVNSTDKNHQVDSMLDSSSALVVSDSSEEVIAANKNKNSKIPTKTIAYLIGIAIFAIFIGVVFILYLLKKRETKKRRQNSLRFEPFLDYHKEKILQAAQHVSASSETSETTQEEYLQNPDEGSSETQELDSVPEMEEKNARVGDFDLADSFADATEIARSLNLGVGELELALNLKAQQRLANNNMNLQTKLEELHDQNVPVTEIARQFNLGQGEVELLLALKKNTAENELY